MPGEKKGQEKPRRALCNLCGMRHYSDGPTCWRCIAGIRERRAGPDEYRERTVPREKGVERHD